MATTDVGVISAFVTSVDSQVDTFTNGAATAAQKKQIIMVAFSTLYGTSYPTLETPISQLVDSLLAWKTVTKAFSESPKV